MDPMGFEIAIEKLDCTADVWRRLVEFAAGCQVRRALLPPPSTGRRP